MAKRKNNTSPVADFTFGDAKLFKDILDLAEKFVDELVVTVNMDSLSIRQMGPDRTTMLDYTINKAVFEEWQVHTQGKLCWNISDIKKKVLRGLSKDTKLRVFIDGKDEKAVFTLKNSRERQRTLPLLELSEEMKDDIPLPKITFTARAKVVAKDFQKDFQDLHDSEFEHGTLMTDNEQLVFEGKDADGLSFRNTYRRYSDALLDLDAQGITKATYSIKRLVEEVFPKEALALCDLATFEWNTNLPIKVSLLFSHPDCKFVHYLAPQIEEEES